MKAIEKGPLAKDYSTLEGTLDRALSKPPRGLSEKTIEAYRLTIESRKRAFEEGGKAANVLTTELAEAFRKANGQIFGDG